MNVIERRLDGSLLCVLSPAEVAKLTGDRTAPRKWWVTGITALPGRPDAQHSFGHVVHASTWNEAEREGARLAIAERRGDAVVQRVDAKDVTGKTRGIFGWR